MGVLFTLFEFLWVSFLLSILWVSFLLFYLGVMGVLFTPYYFSLLFLLYKDPSVHSPIKITHVRVDRS